MRANDGHVTALSQANAATPTRASVNRPIAANGGTK
jgi:hypothetical protein